MRGGSRQDGAPRGVTVQRTLAPRGPRGVHAALTVQRTLAPRGPRGVHAALTLFRSRGTPSASHISRSRQVRHGDQGRTRSGLTDPEPQFAPSHQARRHRSSHDGTARGHTTKLTSTAIAHWTANRPPRSYARINSSRASGLCIPAASAAGNGHAMWDYTADTSLLPPVQPELALDSCSALSPYTPTNTDRIGRRTSNLG
jgi:hypothetical protein